MAGLAILLGPGFGAEPAPSAVKAAKAAPRPPLRVCLVSGANDSKPYATDTTLKELADYLRQEDRMVREVVVMNPAGTGFVSLERLLAADAAIFFVRRKTPDAAQLAIRRQFFASGKGFIALRSTSHARDTGGTSTSRCWARGMGAMARAISATLSVSSSRLIRFGRA